MHGTTIRAREQLCHIFLCFLLRPYECQPTFLQIKLKKVTGKMNIIIIPIATFQSCWENEIIPSKVHVLAAVCADTYKN